MTDPTIDRMSRELATARRWATLLASRVWQLEDAIDEHRRLVRSPVSAAETLYRVRADGDETGR